MFVQRISMFHFRYWILDIHYVCTVRISMFHFIYWILDNYYVCTVRKSMFHFIYWILDIHYVCTVRTSMFYFRYWILDIHYVCTVRISMSNIQCQTNFTVVPQYASLRCVHLYVLNTGLRTSLDCSGVVLSQDPVATRHTETVDGPVTGPVMLNSTRGMFTLYLMPRSCPLLVIELLSSDFSIQLSSKLMGSYF